MPTNGNGMRPVEVLLVMEVPQCWKEALCMASWLEDNFDGNSRLSRQTRNGLPKVLNAGALKYCPVRIRSGNSLLGISSCYFSKARPALSSTLWDVLLKFRAELLTHFSELQLNSGLSLEDAGLS